MLVRVYTCQNATLLEITCRSSNNDCTDECSSIICKVILWKQKMLQITETRVCKFSGPD